jgi:hypothetical protein
MDVLGILAAVESHAAATGRFERVNTHEPKNRPSASGLTCAIWLQRAQPIRGSGLASTSLRLAFTVRLYTNMLSEPQDAIDPAMIAAADLLCAAYVGDFTLGGLVRSVDVRGIEGEPLTWTAGYMSQDGTLVRVVDINLPLLVNDVWSEAP